MVLGEVVAEKPGVIGRLQQLQALFVETVDWTGAAVDPIEHAKADLVHRRPPLAYRAILGRPGGKRNEIQVKQSLRIAKRTPASTSSWPDLGGRAELIAPGFATRF